MNKPSHRSRSRRNRANQPLDRRLGIFRGRLLQAAGVAAFAMPLLYGSACTQQVIVQGEGNGGAGGESSNGGAGGESTPAVTVNTATNQTSVTVATVNTSSSTGGGGGSVQTECFYMPPEGCPALPDAESYYGPCTYDGYWIQGWVDGPFEQNGECCYEVVVGDEFCGVGRPFTLADGAAVAELAMDCEDWLDEYDADATTTLGEQQRKTLAAMWARDGLFEHASVASFARVALELMALGAPAELVHDTHVAALDEIRHTKMCFALASRFEGATMGPGPLPEAAHARPREGLVAVALATLVEGCIGETVAAAVAREQHMRASDPHAAEVLEQIAEDEASHAELAWRTVAWALRSGGEQVRLALVEALRDAPRHMPELQGAKDSSLECYGRLSHEDVADVARRTLVQVVLPCAHALLAPPKGALVRRAAQV